MFCRHDDELIDKTVLEAPVIGSLKVTSSFSSERLPAEFFCSSVVLTFKCSKCRRVRTIQKGNA